MKKIITLLDRHFEPLCIVSLITAMTAIICAQIVLRLFSVSLSAAEEIARFLFVWAMYLSVSYAIRGDRHIRVTIVIDKLPPTLRMLACNCADLIFLVYSVIVLLFGWKVIVISLELGQIAPATEAPIALLYGSIAVGAALNIRHLLRRLHRRAVAPPP